MTKKVNSPDGKWKIENWKIQRLNENKIELELKLKKTNLSICYVEIIQVVQTRGEFV